MTDKYYVAPNRNLAWFNCPYCNFLAHQDWYQTYGGRMANEKAVDCSLIADLFTSKCQHCGKIAVWSGTALILPKFSTAPKPSEDLPEGVMSAYVEARKIVDDSPRGACALLRLSLLKLMPYLGEKGDNIDSDVGNLVRKGLLPLQVQQALESVRVIRNNAVHPGEIDLRDDMETASALFSLVNIVVDYTITKPKQVSELHNKMPPNAKDATAKRDANKQ